jgi:hypothetical protein
MMPRYYFDLSDGGHTIEDAHGTELPHDRAAIIHACDVARELVQRNEERRGGSSISISDDTHSFLLELPLATVDQTLALLRPEARAILERCREQRRKLKECIHQVRQTVQQSRALIARSRGKPYLCTENGKLIVEAP